MSQKIDSNNWNALVSINAKVNNDDKIDVNVDYYNDYNYWENVESEQPLPDQSSEKLRLLLQEGKWNRDNLVILTCDNDGKSHSVLAAKTNIGTFALDSLMPSVVPLAALTYDWKTMEDVNNQQWITYKEWISYNGPD
jgi:predicted transglutaminase-like cysteine proteinase